MKKDDKDVTAIEVTPELVDELKGKYPKSFNFVKNFTASEEDVARALLDIERSPMDELILAALHTMATEVMMSVAGDLIADLEGAEAAEAPDLPPSGKHYDA